MNSKIEDLWDVELFKGVVFDVEVVEVEPNMGFDVEVELNVKGEGVDVEVEPNEKVGICEDVGLFAEVIIEKGDWVELVGIPNTNPEFVLDGDVCLFEVEGNGKGLKDGTSDLFWFEVSFFFVSIEGEISFVWSVFLFKCPKEKKKKKKNTWVWLLWRRNGESDPHFLN